jgi:hypothetical protein
MRKWFIVISLVFCLLPVLVLGQEAEAPAQQSYFNPVTRFGMVLPSDWQNQSEGAITHFNNGVSDIYVLQSQTTDMQAGIREALGRIDPSYVTEPAKSNVVNLPNGEWTQEIFVAPDGTIISALGQVYDNRTFILAFTHNQPDTDTYAVIVESADVQAGIADAIQRFIEPAVSGDPTETREIGDGQIENRYALADGQVLLAQGQVRGDFTHVILERGPAEQVTTISDAFFSVLLSFYVTPTTTDYLLLGLGVVAAVTLLFIASLVTRYNNLRHDLKTLEQLEAE